MRVIFLALALAACQTSNPHASYTVGAGDAVTLLCSGYSIPQHKQTIITGLTADSRVVLDYMGRKAAVPFHCIARYS